jgi:hypothetical protein
VTDAVIYRHFSKIERADALQASYIKSILLRIGATLVMSRDTTTPAKKCLAVIVPNWCRERVSWPSTTSMSSRLAETTTAPRILQ